MGNVANVSSDYKFGRNDSIGTNLAVMAIDGRYRTPQSGSAVQLRVKAGGSAADTAAGAGAREITLIGLDATGAEVTETLATAGTSASSATTNSFMRLYRAYVSASGSYASATSASHGGDITIERSTGSQDWLRIDSTTTARSQSEVGCLTVPLGKTYYMTNLEVDSDTTKDADLMIFARYNILDTSAPYKAKQLVREFTHIQGSAQFEVFPPLKLPALTDVIVLARVASGSGVTISLSYQYYIVED